jgi:hypothetical protein
MKVFRLGCLCAALIAAGIAAAAQGPAVGGRPSADEVRRIAAKGYVFAYPLVLLDLTRRTTLVRQAMLGVGVNQFVHQRAFPDEHARLVIRPNADTFYSTAWLDLSEEPLMLHVPDTHGRYYVMQLLDAWTETFALPGKRTRGTAEGWFAIVAPGWRGTLPAHVQRIDAPTNTAWLLGRTQVNGSSDYDTVHAIQSGFALMPLHLYPNGGAPAAGPPGSSTLVSPDPPPLQLRRMTATQFFGAVASLLPQNPPHPQDAAMMQELERIGVAPGKPFDPESLGAEGREALDEGVAAAAATLQGTASQGSAAGSNGWSGFSAWVGRYGTHYDARANVARQGLGALPPEEAVYFSCCQGAAGLRGARPYTLHFTKEQLPPMRAFWSLTLYGEDGYFLANPIHRFAIGDRDALKFNADGSLDLYIQHDAPGADRDGNWLPAPEGAFNLTLRLYWPREQVVGGHWAPPPIL